MVPNYSYNFSWDRNTVPKDVEIDHSNLRVYTCTIYGGHPCVDVFDSSGNFIKYIGGIHYPEEEGDLISPQAVAMNRDTRDIYVADMGFYSGSRDRVQQYTAEGVFIRKWGQTGTEDGNFYGSYGIAVDTDGFVYVVDWWGSRCQKFTDDGDFVRSWNVGYFPYNVDCDSNNNVYVAHYGESKVLKYDSDGNPITSWSDFSSISGVAVDSDDNIFTCQRGGSLKIKKFTSNGTLLKSFGASGTTAGKLNSPRGLAISPSGMVYVADYIPSDKSRYSVWVEWEQKEILKPSIGKTIGIETQYIRNGDKVISLPGTKPIALKVPSDYAVPTFSFMGGTYGHGQGQFDHVHSVTVDKYGNIYASDNMDDDRVQKFSPTGAFLLEWGGRGDEDGEFYQAGGLSVDEDGNVFVCDRNVFYPGTTVHHRVQKFNSNGGFLLKWGEYGTGDGQFIDPYNLITDSLGFVYVVDRGNYQIKKFDGDGDFVRKWGEYGGGDGQFTDMEYITIDSNGVIYILDGASVQKFSSDGTFVSRISIAVSAPAGIAVDDEGNIFVSDYIADIIKKFSPDGTYLATIGGHGHTKGLLDNEWGMAFRNQNLYVADVENARIQVFSTNPFKVGDTVAIFPVSGGKLVAYSPIGGRLFFKLQNPSPCPEWFNAIAWHPNGNYFVIGMSYPTIQMVAYKRTGDTFTALPTSIFDTEIPGTPFSCAWSPDGTYLAVAHGGSPFVTIYKVSGETFTKIPDPDVIPYGALLYNGESVAWSPDGNYLFVGCRVAQPYEEFWMYKKVGVDDFNLVEGTPHITSTGGSPQDAEWSPDGRFLALACIGNDGLIVYEQSGDTFTVVFRTPLNFHVNTVAWHPDSLHIAVGTEYGVGNYYKYVGIPYSAFEKLGGIPGISGEVYDCAWSPNGEVLVCGMGDSPFNAVCEQGVDTLTEIDPIPEVSEGEDIYGAEIVSWSPDGHYLIFGINRRSGCSLLIFKI